jgi:hypothetical protein
MMRTDGFYITSNQHLVVDIPVFDEIVDGIQILQFFPKVSQQEGLAMLAEYGELAPHPLEINVEELQKKIQSQMKDMSKEEKDEFCYEIEDSTGHSRLFGAMNSIFKNKKETQKFPRIFTGKYEVKDTKKILIQPNQKNQYQNAEGDFADENLSLVYHYGTKDYISIFKFVPFY